MEQGRLGFMDYLADQEDHRHLGRRYEGPKGEDMKKNSLIGGLKDRTQAAN